MGYQAQSLLGHQAEVSTDCAFGSARIVDIKASRVKELLKGRSIVVVAGFQGCDEAGNITTLGRGGSDTSAVAIASALNADVCEIYTDVDGIYTTDPNICEKARKLKTITYDEMLEMASLGAKVLQIRSVEFAKKYNVPVHVRSSFSEEEGTMLVSEDMNMERPVVIGVTLDKNEVRIAVRKVPDQPGICGKDLLAPGRRQYRGGHDHPERPGRGHARCHLYGHQSPGQEAEQIARKVAAEINAEEVSVADDIAKVSITGVGMKSHSGVAAKMFSTLAEEEHQHPAHQHLRDSDFLRYRQEVRGTGGSGPSQGLRAGQGIAAQ